MYWVLLVDLRHHDYYCIRLALYVWCQGSDRCGKGSRQAHGDCQSRLS